VIFSDRNIFQSNLLSTTFAESRSQVWCHNCTGKCKWTAKFRLYL